MHCRVLESAFCLLNTPAGSCKTLSGLKTFDWTSLLVGMLT